MGITKPQAKIRILRRASLSDEPGAVVPTSPASIRSGMKTSRNTESNWRFPADLIVVLGIPVFLAWFVSTVLFRMMEWQGTRWLIAYFVSMLLATIGASMILRAKLPLYRSCRFFTFGIKNIPQPLKRIYKVGMVLSATGCGLAGILLLGALLWR